MTATEVESMAHIEKPTNRATAWISSLISSLTTISPWQSGPVIPPMKRHR